ncbi:unnamed protein product, partial [Iphiclides podalirius]
MGYHRKSRPTGFPFYARVGGACIGPSPFPVFRRYGGNNPGPYFALLRLASRKEVEAKLNEAITRNAPPTQCCNHA